MLRFQARRPSANVATLPAPSTSLLLTRLERIARRFGEGGAPQKLQLLRHVARRRLTTPAQVRRLHEVICFLRAYPDDADVLAEVERQVATFGQRRDVAAMREELADSGIAGTPIQYQFHWPTARWLAARWPRHLDIDWEWFDSAVTAPQLLDLAVSRAQVVDIASLDLTTEQWIERIKGPGQTGGTFVVRRFEALEVDEPTRQTIYETLDVPMRLSPGPDTPSRTRAKVALHAPVFQRAPLSSARPDLAAAIRVPPRSVKDVVGARAEALIDVAREAMVTRARDLDAIQHANPEDVRLIDVGDGVMLSCIGLLPAFRPLVETVHVFVLHKNGVPLGYYQSALLFGSAELNYNVFEPFRGTQAAAIYAKALSAVHHLFGADVFAVDPYQLGQDNDEALASGAFWFYQKLGFRPAEAGARRVLAREQRRMARDPAHRSSPATLRRLASGHVYFHLDRPRDDVAGKVCLDRIGLAVGEWVARHHGGDSEAAEAECSRRVRACLGLPSASALDPTQRRCLARWSVLACVLGVERWSRPERRAVVSILLAKAATREDAFAIGLARHARLRGALLRLAASG